MSNSLKQDIINSVGKDRYIQSCKEIAQMYDDAERGICSNIEINTAEELSLYNVQFDIPKFDKHYTKLVIAINHADAINIIIKRYKHFGINKSGIYCEQVTMKRGMVFNV